MSSTVRGPRNSANEYRALSLFNKLSEDQHRYNDSHPNEKKQIADWNKQPEFIRDVFRHLASFNTYRHGSGRTYGWSFCNQCFEFKELRHDEA